VFKRVPQRGRSLMNAHRNEQTTVSVKKPLSLKRSDGKRITTSFKDPYDRKTNIDGTSQNRKPLHICLFGYLTYENDARVLRYAEALAERGEEVEVICIGKRGTPKKEVVRGIPVLHIQGRKYGEHTRASFFGPLVRFLIKGMVIITLKHLRKPFDIVHVNVPPDFHVFGMVLLRMTGAKIILDIHDLSPELFADKFEHGHNSIVVKTLKLIERAACALSSHVIAANDLWRTTLVSRSVNNDRCTALINYPGPIFMSRKSKQLSGSSIATPLVLYPGSLGTHQGLAVGVRAVKLLVDHNVPLHFAIYGRGPEEEPLRLLVKELGLESTVSINPMLPLEKIADVMTTAAIGIVTKLGDGFGGQAFSTKILEFMAIGVPVLVSETPIDKYYFNDTLVEFFRSGDPADCAKHLQRLLEDEALRASRIANGLAFVSENNWDVKKSVYLNIINKLTGVSHAT
jgi:glycosyltransferase involved in cell wall biosynthesis